MDCIHGLSISWEPVLREGVNDWCAGKSFCLLGSGGLRVADYGGLEVDLVYYRVTMTM